MKFTYQNHNLLEQYFHQQCHSSGCSIKSQIDITYIDANTSICKKCLKAILKNNSEYS